MLFCCQYVMRDMYPRDLEVIEELADAPDGSQSLFHFG